MHNPNMQNQNMQNINQNTNQMSNMNNNMGQNMNNNMNNNMNYTPHMQEICSIFSRMGPNNQPYNIDLGSKKKTLLPLIYSSVMIIAHPHPLYNCIVQQRAYSNFWTCRKCQCNYTNFVPSFYCTLCNFDICQKCLMEYPMYQIEIYDYSNGYNFGNVPVNQQDPNFRMGLHNHPLRKIQIANYNSNKYRINCLKCKNTINSNNPFPYCSLCNFYVCENCFNNQQIPQTQSSQQPHNFNNQNQMNQMQFNNNNQGFGQNNPNQGYNQNQRNQGYGPNNQNQGYNPNNQNQGYGPNNQNQGYNPNNQNQGYNPNNQNQGYNPNMPNQGYNPNMQNQGYNPNMPNQGFNQNNQMSFNNQNQNNQNQGFNQNNQQGNQNNNEPDDYLDADQMQEKQEKKK